MASEKGPERSSFGLIFAAISAVYLLGIGAITITAAAISDGGGGGAAASTETTTIEVMLTEFKVEPASVDVVAGQKVQLIVTNHGTMPHDLKVDGATGTKMLDPGATETVTVGPFDASTQAWCTVAGHKDAGMVMDINVAGGGGGSSGGSTAATGETPGARPHQTPTGPPTTPSSLPLRAARCTTSTCTPSRRRSRSPQVSPS